MKRGEAKEYRLKIESAAVNLTDSEAFSSRELFPEFKAGRRYCAGDRFKLGGVLYKVVQEHTSQSDWSPDDLPALYTPVPDPLSEYPEWVQPLGSEDAYVAGAKVSYGGKRYVSDIDENVWQPGVYGWSEIP